MAVLSISHADATGAPSAGLAYAVEPMPTPIDDGGLQVEGMALGPDGIISADPITGTLDAAGSASVDLVPSGDPPPRCPTGSRSARPLAPRRRRT